jgi:hypothetical protein
MKNIQIQYNYFITGYSFQSALDSMFAFCAKNSQIEFTGDVLAETVNWYLRPANQNCCLGVLKYIWPWKTSICGT